MSFPRRALLALPYMRLELPGWGHVYRALSGQREAAWADAPARILRDKLHGYSRRVELSNWSERMSWFLGRFYDLETQLLVRSAVREGDTVVDVGANIGMITLLAARCVGPRGRVHAVEPNPAARARLETALAENGIGCVTVHALGLSDRDEELLLQVVSAHTGLGTFAPVDGHDRDEITATYRVPVRRGDELFAGRLGAPTLLKIDVEGFECRTLRGFDRVLRENRPAIVIEAIEVQLQRAGSSLAELFDLLGGHGYRGYALRSARRFHARDLLVDPLAGPAEATDNLLWLHPEGVHVERLRNDRRVRLGRAREPVKETGVRAL